MVPASSLVTCLTYSATSWQRKVDAVCVPLHGVLLLFVISSVGAFRPTNSLFWTIPTWTVSSPEINWRSLVGMDKSIYSAHYTLFLELLRDARQRAGLTQEEVALHLGNTQSFVSKCERGERRLDIVEVRENL